MNTPLVLRAAGVCAAGVTGDAATAGEHLAVLRALDHVAHTNAHAARVYIRGLTNGTAMLDGLPVTCWQALRLLDASPAPAHRQRQYEVLCLVKALAKERATRQESFHELGAAGAAMKRLEEQTGHMPALHAKVCFDGVQLDGEMRDTQRLSQLYNSAAEALRSAAPTDSVAVARAVDALCAWLQYRHDTARERLARLGPPEPLLADIAPGQYHVLVDWLLRAARQAAFDVFNSPALFAEPTDDWCVLSPAYRSCCAPLLRPEEIQALIAARGDDWRGFVHDAYALMEGNQVYKDIHAARALFEYIYANCPASVATDGEFHKYDALFYLAWSFSAEKRRMNPRAPLSTTRNFCHVFR